MTNDDSKKLDSKPVNLTKSNITETPWINNIVTTPIATNIKRVLILFPRIISKLLLKHPAGETSGSNEKTWNINIKYMKKNAPTTQKNGINAISQNSEYKSQSAT